MKTTNDSRAAALREVDRILHGLGRAAPSAAALLDVRRELAAVTRPPRATEIMTIEEVGDMLRLSPAELEQIVPDLPAFELAGRLRLRRQRLMEWIENRERAYVRASIQSAVEHSLELQTKEGVA